MDKMDKFDKSDKFDELDEFEDQLRRAFERRPAPPSLKRRVMERRQSRRTFELRRRAVIWQRLAASFVLAALLGGGIAWRHVEEQRKGEEARQQVMTALRITSRALDQINARLAARDRADHE
jgi:hypothetical protein